MNTPASTTDPLTVSMRAISARLTTLKDQWGERTAGFPDENMAVAFDRGYHAAMETVLEWVDGTSDRGVYDLDRIRHEIACYVDAVDDWIPASPTDPDGPGPVDPVST